MNHKSEFAVVMTAVASEADAKGLAGKIVQERLAACVQCVPIHSTYRWEGKIESAEEHLLLAKTTSALTDKLVAFITSAHSYELPEIIVTPITGGLDRYLDWVKDETSDGKP